MNPELVSRFLPTRNPLDAESIQHDMTNFIDRLSLFKIDLDLETLLLVHGHFKGLFVIEVVESMGNELLKISGVFFNRLEAPWEIPLSLQSSRKFLGP